MIKLDTKKLSYAYDNLSANIDYLNGKIFHLENKLDNLSEEERLDLKHKKNEMQGYLTLLKLLKDNLTHGDYHDGERDYVLGYPKGTKY